MDAIFNPFNLYIWNFCASKFDKQKVVMSSISKTLEQEESRHKAWIHVERFDKPLCGNDSPYFSTFFTYISLLTKSFTLTSMKCFLIQLTLAYMSVCI